MLPTSLCVVSWHVIPYLEQGWWQHYAGTAVTLCHCYWSVVGWLVTSSWSVCVTHCFTATNVLQPADRSAVFWSSLPKRDRPYTSNNHCWCTATHTCKLCALCNINMDLTQLHTTRTDEHSHCPLPNRLLTWLGASHAPLQLLYRPERVEVGTQNSKVNIGCCI